MPYPERDRQLQMRPVILLITFLSIFIQSTETARQLGYASIRWEQVIAVAQFRISRDNCAPGDAAHPSIFHRKSTLPSRRLFSCW
jgi:hypothetical protein